MYSHAYVGVNIYSHTSALTCISADMYVGGLHLSQH